MFITDPDNDLLTTICSSMVGQTFTLSLRFATETLELQNCEGLNNMVGSLLENGLYLILNQVLPHFIRGPKQRSPDYYNRKIYEYELKCFEKNPNFDISAYDTYITQLAENDGLQRKLLYTRYLVFQYELVGCQIYIRNFWALNIWQLVNYSGKYPISIQNKRGIWYNIRPSSEHTWTCSTHTIERFMKQLCSSISQCPNPSNPSQFLPRILTQWEMIKQQNTIN